MTNSPPLTTQEARPLDRFLGLLKSPREYSKGWSARCPAHNDSKASLMAWEDKEDQHVGVMCFAGCSRKAICEALNISEEDLYLDDPTKAKKGARRKAIDLYDLSIDKVIHHRDLLLLGLRDGEETFHRRDGSPYIQKGVIITYYTADGKPYERWRLRTALKATDGSPWNTGSKAPIIPYGLHRLKDAVKEKYLIIPEGESDPWTLWLHKFPALGIPGARMASVLQKDHIPSEIEKIYIIQEPQTEKDKEQKKDPGKEFVEGVSKRLKEIDYQGKVYALDFKEATGEKDPNDLHKRDVKAFKKKMEAALLRARPLQEEPKKLGKSLKDLMAKELPPVKWAIPEMLPEGLTLLCGKPKLGKSWLALDLALAISYGGMALGQKQVEQGEVLYLALEDNERRMQSRVRQLLHEGMKVPNDFYYNLECPRLNEGGYEAMEDWIKEHPRARMIVIDTWVKIAPQSQNKQRSQYEEDYASLSLIKKLSDQYNISIVCIHHLRKSASDSNDFLDEVSGSVGTTGTVDNILGLKRERGQFDATLHITGRDIEDDSALALTFDQTSAHWSLQGKASDFAKTRERQAIIDQLSEYPEGQTAKEVAELLQKNFYTIKNTLNSMFKAGEVRKEGSKYVAVATPKPQNNNNNILSLHSHRSLSSQSSLSSRSSRSDETTSETTTSDYVAPSSDYDNDYSVVSHEVAPEAVPQKSDYGDYGDYADHSQSNQKHNQNGKETLII